MSGKPCKKFPTICSEECEHWSKEEKRCKIESEDELRRKIRKEARRNVSMAKLPNRDERRGRRMRPEIIERTIEETVVKKHLVKPNKLGHTVGVGKRRINYNSLEVIATAIERIQIDIKNIYELLRTRKRRRASRKRKMR